MTGASGVPFPPARPPAATGIKPEPANATTHQDPGTAPTAQELPPRRRPVSETVLAPSVSKQKVQCTVRVWDYIFVQKQVYFI